MSSRALTPEVRHLHNGLAGGNWSGSVRRKAGTYLPLIDMFSSAALARRKFVNAVHATNMNFASAKLGAISPSVNACLIPPESLVNP